MAIDEVLLSGLGACQRILRIYRWDRRARSIGYFSSWKEQAAFVENHGTESLVRRLTGGGVVDHERDLTYTILCGEDDPWTHLASGERYRVIHEPVVAAFH